MADVDLKKIYILLGAGIFILSFSGILIKLATAPPLIIAFYRMLFTSIIITPVFFYKYKGYLKYFLDYRPAVVGVFLSIHFFLWMSAFEYTSVANAVIFISIQPLFTLLL
ncbi:MAG: EamA family transporter, partial [Halanaerobiaceae bacterium]